MRIPSNITIPFHFHSLPGYLLAAHHCFFWFFVLLLQMDRDGDGVISLDDLTLAVSEVRYFGWYLAAEQKFTNIASLVCTS